MRERRNVSIYVLGLKVGPKSLQICVDSATGSGGNILKICLKPQRVTEPNRSRIMKIRSGRISPSSARLIDTN